ncbi:MAG TPA: single-stranded DNA-binding protein [Nocardioidaceae bacterium]|nr:single-stranded DNA-binding protein [Nocardioidaceae bacterium]
MNDAMITFQGWLGGDVTFRDTARGSVANLRVGSTPRIRRQNGDWVDGETNWFSVTCWRALAENVRDSLRKGDPVIVHGRLRTDVWERADGQLSTTYVVEATYVGHDLARGTSLFTKTARPEKTGADDDSEKQVKEMVHEQPGDLPEVDRWGLVERAPMQEPGEDRVA